jgi:D-serine deaminase-like pyridoxal phosphate-dependent protein
VVRSGCYLTHDHGTYAASSPLSPGASAWVELVGALKPALSLWAHVLSQPEPGLALLGFGKRDAPIDAGFPVPVAHHPHRGAQHDIESWTITALNDQHAYLGTDPATVPAVGDVVVLGISHPCTAFDRWRLVMEVDADHDVVGAIRTFF